jgi:hypothetical protein
MSEHRSWRERVGKHSDSEGQPVFESSRDPVLAAFAELYLDSGLVAFDASKRLRTDAFSPLYDCETESLREGERDPELFVAIWTPVWDGSEPVTGFRTGHDSAYLGTTPTVAMPQDERTAALLLLVTSSFVHLSARRDDSALLIQGALDADGDNFRFVQLMPDAVPASAEDARAESS